MFAGEQNQRSASLRISSSTSLKTGKLHIILSLSLLVMVSQSALTENFTKNQRRKCYSTLANLKQGKKQLLSKTCKSSSEACISVQQTMATCSMLDES